MTIKNDATTDVMLSDADLEQVAGGKGLGWQTVPHGPLKDQVAFAYTVNGKTEYMTTRFVKQANGSVAAFQMKDGKETLVNGNVPGNAHSYLLADLHMM